MEDRGASNTGKEEEPKIGWREDLVGFAGGAVTKSASLEHNHTNTIKAYK